MTNRSRLDLVHTKIMRFHLKYLLIYSVISQSACEIHPFHAILPRSHTGQCTQLITQATYTFGRIGSVSGSTLPAIPCVRSVTTSIAWNIGINRTCNWVASHISQIVGWQLLWLFLELLWYLSWKCLELGEGGGLYVHGCNLSFSTLSCSCLACLPRVVFLSCWQDVSAFRPLLVNELCCLVNWFSVYMLEV